MSLKFLLKISTRFKLFKYLKKRYNEKGALRFGERPIWRTTDLAKTDLAKTDLAKTDLASDRFGED